MFLPLGREGRISILTLQWSQVQREPVCLRPISNQSPLYSEEVKPLLGPMCHVLEYQGWPVMSI